MRQVGTSRPIVNLHEKKWVTAGTATVDPVAAPHGRIVGSADCGWTESVVGRYLAIAEKGEFLENTDGGAYMHGLAGQHGNRTYRWYPIRSFNRLPDGTCELRVERIWYAVRDGIPTLYDADNVGRPLHYIIAPGAMATDIADGWLENPHERPSAAHKRTIGLAPGPDRGTRFDFEPGDPIVQAIGAEPRLPTGLRNRTFNKVPSSWPSGAIELFNWGLVSTYAGLQVGAPGEPTRTEDALARQKEQRPAFRNAMVVETVTETGSRFNADFTEGAIVFQQPHRAQPMRWRWAEGWSALAVDPATGRMEVSASELSAPSLLLKGGISAGDRPARNLRGIHVPVPAGETSLAVRFDAPEVDARYSLTVQPGWVTATGVTERRADGFTVQFATPAPEGARLDWPLVR